jgi:hypothetical protein
MKLYNSYIKTTKNGDIQDIAFVKNGFSFSAFFLNFFWFAHRKMVKISIAAFVINIALIEIISAYIPSSYDALLVLFSTSSLIAVNSSLIHSKYLESKGYKFVGCIFGKNKVAANLRFVEGYIEDYKKENSSKQLFKIKDQDYNLTDTPVLHP